MTQQRHGPASIKASMYEPHPLALKIPRPSKVQYEALKASIRAQGLVDPIVLHEGKILSGVTRGQICDELGIEPFETYQGSDPEGFVFAKDLARRHLSEPQRAM